MPSPIPKPASLRQRRNKTSTAANLPPQSASATNDVPDLFPREGGGEWHPMVLEWWDSVWRSPMASEYLDADMRGGLFLLADLHQARWTATSRTALIEAAKEIRLQEVRFGLSPIDRRRLQWEVEKGEQAIEKTTTRRERKAPKRPAGDPRLKIA